MTGHHGQERPAYSQQDSGSRPGDGLRQGKRCQGRPPQGSGRAEIRSQGCGLISVPVVTALYF